MLSAIAACVQKQRHLANSFLNFQFSLKPNCLYMPYSHIMYDIWFFENFCFQPTNILLLKKQLERFLMQPVIGILVQIYLMMVINHCGLGKMVTKLLW